MVTKATSDRLIVAAQLDAQVKCILDILTPLSEDIRYNIMSRIQDKFCTYCGSDIDTELNEVCYCRHND